MPILRDILHPHEPESSDSADKESSGPPVEDTIVYARVYLTNGSVHKESYLTQVPKVTLSKGNLSQFRAIIAGSTESKETSQLPFCTKKGAVVPDFYTIKTYVTKCLETKLDEEATYLDVYMKKETLPEAPSPDTVTLSQVVDANRLALLKQAFDENAFKLLTGTSAKSVAELEEQDWAMVSASNGLCYGVNVVRKKDGDKVVPVGVERARYPAFRFKQRTFFSDMLASTSVKDVEMDLRVPEYAVDDQSYVSVYETANSLQSSLAASSFTQTDVSAAASGSIFGCSLSASASYGESAQKSSISAKASNNKIITIAFNFPRVTLYLDQDDLEMTRDCQAALSNIRDAAGLTKFLEDYGEFYSTRVQLGGQLHSTEEVESASSSDVKATVDSMKASAAVAFSGWGASASVSASHQESTAKSQAGSGRSATHAVTWQAKGGDTLLCNDPKAWCPSVAFHYYWRTIKQENVLHMIKLMSKFPGFKDLETKAAKEWAPVKVASPPPKSQEFLLQAQNCSDGRYLATYEPNVASLMDVVSAVGAKFGATPANMAAHYYGSGAVAMSPTPRDQSRVQYRLHVEAENGDAVGEVCYETPYRLMTTASRLYVDWFLRFDSRMMVRSTTSKGLLILFRASDGKIKSGAIPYGADVSLQFLADEKKKGAFGFAFMAAEGNGKAYLMLAVTAKEAKLKPQLMTFRATDDE